MTLIYNIYPSLCIKGITALTTDHHTAAAAVPTLHTHSTVSHASQTHKPQDIRTRQMNARSPILILPVLIPCVACYPVPYGTHEGAKAIEPCAQQDTIRKTC